MTTPHAARILLIGCLLALLAGCNGSGCAVLFAPRARSHEKDLGHIDLSTKGSKCEGVFRWNSYYPGLVLFLSDTNGATRTIGANPDWPLVVSLDVLDGRRAVASTSITRDRLVFANWNAPATCLLVRAPNGFFGPLRAGHSYRFVLTVSQEEKSLGSAKVVVHWITGADSM
jgi:hypothetical protein